MMHTLHLLLRPVCFVNAFVIMILDFCLLWVLTHRDNLLIASLIASLINGVFIVIIKNAPIIRVLLIYV